MVEALIVILSFVVIDISLIYMKGAYDGRLTSMRGARKDVWQSALKGSGGGGGGDGSLAPAAGQTATAMQIARGETLTKPLQTTLSTVTSTSSSSSHGQATPYGTYGDLSMTTRNEVMAEEIQDDISEGDIQATINSLYETLL
jgi:hypothetical protein